MYIIFKLTTRYSNTSPRQSHLFVPKSWFNFSSTRVYTNFSLIRIWTTMCLFLFPLWLNRLLHTSHENGFSPVCIRSCRTLSLRLAKDLEQNRHGKCLTPSIMYVLSSDAEMKRKHAMKNNKRLNMFCWSMFWTNRCIRIYICLENKRASKT